MMNTGKIGNGFIWLSLNLGIRGSAFVVFSFLASAVISMGAGAPIAALFAVIPIFYPPGILLGASPAMLTGALISGIFFGDALSPSSQVINCFRPGLRRIRTAVQAGDDSGRDVHHIRAPLPEIRVFHLLEHGRAGPPGPMHRFLGALSHPDAVLRHLDVVKILQQQPVHGKDRSPLLMEPELVVLPCFRVTDISL